MFSGAMSGGHVISRPVVRNHPSSQPYLPKTHPGTAKPGLCAGFRLESGPVTTSSVAGLWLNRPSLGPDEQHQQL